MASCLSPRTVGPDSPPNAAFLPDQDGISDKVLDTPNFLVNSAAAQLTFRHNYDMESSDADYDGCVLEVVHQWWRFHRHS